MKMDIQARRALARALANRVIAEAMTQASRTLQADSTITIQGVPADKQDVDAVRNFAVNLLHELQLTHAAASSDFLDTARSVAGNDLELKIE